MHSAEGSRPMMNGLGYVSARRAAVWRSFALGWDLASLFVNALEAPLSPEVQEDLPGLNRLPLAILVGSGLDAVDASLRALDRLVGVSAPDLVETVGVRQVLACPTTADTSIDRRALRQAVRELHIKVLTSLIAADASCGKAYRLGQALAETCAAPQSALQLSDSLNPDRMATIRAWLDDLKSLLPDHAAEAVSSSLGAWADWAYLHPPMHMTSQDVSSVVGTLHAQGQRWWALLSFEKGATDALDLEDHVTIARRILPHIWSLGFAPPLWLPWALVTGLFGLGVALAVTSDNAARVIAGLGMIAASVAVTWRMADLLLAQVGSFLGEPIWGAERDRMIAERVTLMPSLVAGVDRRRVVARSAPGPRRIPPPPMPPPPMPPPPMPPPPIPSETVGSARPVTVPQGGGTSFHDDDTVTVELSGDYARDDDPGPDGPAL